MSSSDFYKIRRLPPYVFEEVNRLKARLRAKGVDIIDFGMGNPDLPVPEHIVDKLCETARKPRTNRYSASRGIPGLRKAMAGYYDRRFGVKLNPDTQIVSTLGSKEGFANLAQAITAPGDVIISPNPSYPIHAFGFIMAGGVIRSIEAHSPEQYLRGIDRAVRHSVPPPIAMVLCYPANPTAQTADLDFYKDAVAMAKKHEMFVLSDMAYSEIYFDGDPPPSVLQVNGATDVTVEVNTLSKTYSMAGFRVGFALGNERLIAALSRVKSYLDYGAYTPVQVAAAAALNGPQGCVEEMRNTYKARRDVLVESFAKAGLGGAEAVRVDVLLGAAARAVQARGFGGVLQAVDGGRGDRRGAGRRFWRIRRWLRPHRARGKRTAHPPSRAQSEALPAIQRRARRGVVRA